MNKKQISKTKESNKDFGRPAYEISELAVKVLKAPKGLTDDQLAKAIGISRAHFYKIKADKVNKDFLDAVLFYRDARTLEVIKAFEKVAVGFSFDETTKALKKNKETGKMELVTTKVVTKHVAPNEAAAFKYLKNKLPDHFKDKQEVEVTGDSNLDRITIIFAGKES
ncbi:MAG: hypothetical protein BWY74_03278 [Firmicutes bacterium ADurb.Bin419]|nr:MAG: hypothetical protein BWY74_03278 [Firmicutes bacterium ADurb.Bin419]